VAAVELNEEKNVGWKIEWDVTQVKMPVVGKTRGAELRLGQALKRLDA
jgi:hypothetical protein